VVPVADASLPGRNSLNGEYLDERDMEKRASRAYQIFQPRALTTSTGVADNTLNICKYRNCDGTCTSYLLKNIKRPFSVPNNVLMP
jgi:hypothetical protein